MATDKELGWDDEIEEVENNFPEYKELEGVYGFRITSFKRGRHEKKPEGKAPSCNKAILEFDALDPETGEKVGVAKKDLLLCLSCKFLHNQLAISIGAKRHGEAISGSDFWNNLVGKEGSFRLTVRRWAKRDDKPGEKTGWSNEVVEFLEPADPF